MCAGPFAVVPVLCVSYIQDVRSGVHAAVAAHEAGIQLAAACCQVTSLSILQAMHNLYHKEISCPEMRCGLTQIHLSRIRGPKCHSSYLEWLTKFGGAVLAAYENASYTVKVGMTSAPC